jgi:hypothetical protein
MATPASWFRGLSGLDRTRPRIVVVAAFAGYTLLILGYAMLVAPGAISTTVWAPLAVLVFATTIVGVAALCGYGPGRMGESRALDERERAMTDRALVFGDGVLSTVLAPGLRAVAGYASVIGPLTISMTELTPVLIAGGLYVPLPPFAALAWIEPDIPNDDAEYPE